MREYRLDESEKDQNNYYLVPLGETKPNHVILFKDRDKAHKFRLALGLGTHPDPEKSPDSYSFGSRYYLGSKIFEPSDELNTVEDEFDPGCCQSGCPGCPWTLEQIRLGKL